MHFDNLVTYASSSFGVTEMKCDCYCFISDLFFSCFKTLLISYNYNDSICVEVLNV